MEVLTQSIPTAVLAAQSIGDAKGGNRQQEGADQDEDFGIHHQEFGERHHRAIPVGR